MPTIYVKPQPPRYTLRTSSAGLEIRPIPPAYEKWISSAALLGYCVVATAIIYFLPDRQKIFELAFWSTTGGLVVAVVCLYRWKGDEVIRVNKTILSHRFELFGSGIGRNYFVEEIKDLRAVPYADGSIGWFHLPILGQGTITFDYRGRSIRMGRQFSEAEAFHIVHTMADDIPNAVDPAPVTSNKIKVTGKHGAPTAHRDRSKWYSWIDRFLSRLSDPAQFFGASPYALAVDGGRVRVTSRSVKNPANLPFLIVCVVLMLLGLVALPRSAFVQSA